MRFPLTDQLIDEARRFELRSACRDCAHWDERGETCGNQWPDEGQRRWPIDAPDPQTGERVADIAFCKEFELT